MNLKFGDPASIAAAAAAAAAARPIEQMWLSFGKRTDRVCVDCEHWLGWQGDYGCGLYERTHKHAMFHGDADACGKFDA